MDKTRRGELMVRNLREDANVCPALQQQLRDFVAAEPVATTPDEAAEIQECVIAGPLQRNPADNYKAIRLGTRAIPAP